MFNFKYILVQNFTPLSTLTYKSSQLIICYTFPNYFYTTSVLFIVCLVVNVAHVGSIDHEGSHSTIDMCSIIVEELAKLYPSDASLWVSSLYYNQPFHLACSFWHVALFYILSLHNKMPSND